MSLALLQWLNSNHIPSLPHGSAQSILTARILPTVKQRIWWDTDTFWIKTLIIPSVCFHWLHYDLFSLNPTCVPDSQVGSGPPLSRADIFPPATVVHSSLPLGGTASSSKQVSIRHVDLWPTTAMFNYSGYQINKYVVIKFLTNNTK